MKKLVIGLKFEKNWRVDLSKISADGSKLNETARSYKMLAEESKNIGGFKFVWITDGKSRNSARRNLKETFLILPNMYNIQDLRNGIFLELFK